MSAGRTLRVFTYEGDPNGHMYAPTSGYICIDTAPSSTAAYLSHAQGRTSWVEIGGGGTPPNDKLYARNCSNRPSGTAHTWTVWPVEWHTKTVVGTSIAEATGVITVNTLGIYAVQFFPSVNSTTTPVPNTNASFTARVVTVTGTTNGDLAAVPRLSWRAFHIKISTAASWTMVPVNPLTLEVTARIAAGATFQFRIGGIVTYPPSPPVTPPKEIKYTLGTCPLLIRRLS